MSELTLDQNNAKYQIRGYTPGTIQVNELTLNRSIIIAPNMLITDWEPQTIAELTPLNLAIAADLEPAILLIGTGAVLTFPPLEIYGDLLNRRIGVEIMDTHAACRTYAALASEERNVVAALIIK